MINTAAESPSRMPAVIVGAWQLSTGHHKAAANLETALLQLEQIVELQVGEPAVAFDCADIYSGVEEALGVLLKRLAPRTVTGELPALRVHTKLVPDRSRLAGVDRAYVTSIVDRSLKRLGVEQLDLVQFAWWDYDVPGYVECGLLLGELRRAGKIAHIGVTNFDTPRLREILDAGVPIVSHQIQYSALDDRAEAEMADLCCERDVSILSYGTLAGGFLTDRWLGKPDPAPGGIDDALALPSRSLTKYRLIIDEFGGWAAYQALLGTLAAIAKAHDASVAQVAMAYVLSRPGVGSIIAGATRPDRWADAVHSKALKLTADETTRIRAHAGAAPGPVGPVFGLERDPATPHAAIMKYDLNAGSESIG